MPTSIFAPVDLYCERLGPEFWAEPANAFSNLAFVVAGLWGLAMVRRRGAGRFAELLSWWVVAIGVGSALFHTFANRLTIWADILPIAGFTIVYTVFALRRFAAFGWPSAVVSVLVFYALTVLLAFMAVPAWLRDATNGSTGYLPAFLALIIFGVLILARGSKAGWYNVAAGGVFALALTCRMLDPMVCGSFPLGTHFLWHILNGLMLALLLAAISRFGAPAKG